MTTKTPPPETPPPVPDIDDSANGDGPLTACARCHFPLKFHDEVICQAVDYLEEFCEVALQEMPSLANVSEVIKKTVEGGIRANANVIRERVFRSSRTRDRELHK